MAAVIGAWPEVWLALGFAAAIVALAATPLVANRVIERRVDRRVRQRAVEQRATAEQQSTLPPAPPREHRAPDLLISLPSWATPEDGQRWADTYRSLAPGTSTLVRGGGREVLVTRHPRRRWHGPGDVL